MNINQLIKQSHEIAIEKGWHETEVPFEVSIANIHAELSEAWEDYRNNRGLNEIYFENKGYEVPKKPCGIPVELADILIRIFDLCGAYEIDLEKAIELKMAYNKTRPYRHGGKRA